MHLTLEVQYIKFERSYVSFGENYFEIEFTEAYSHKRVISLSKSDILRSQS